MNWKGKVVVITGGAGGIGRETALKFASPGAMVYLVDIDGGRAKKTLAKIEAAGARARFLKADLEDVAQIKILFREILAADKKIDILVNCAGICFQTPVPEITPEEWDRVFSANLRSVFFCSQEALRTMCRRKSGKIINLASASGKIGGVAVGAHYAASKAAIICLTKSLALYAAPYGVNVNCVCPGPIATPMTEAWGGKINAAFAKNIPLKRYGKPEEVAAAICFLASDRASYITGETLDVNGGLVMD